MSPSKAYEAGPWPYIQAAHFGPRRTGTARLIVIHDAECPETPKAARAIAEYFATTSRAASAHICVDNQEVIQSVHDSYVAYAAPGANHDGIQVEIAGFGWQKPNDWLDSYSIGALALAADATAQYCLKYGIPPIHLTDGSLLSGARGIVGHVQVSRVYRKSDHEDPGPDFPWTRFMMMVEQHYHERK